jgi:hypothetical protein
VESLGPSPFSLPPPTPSTPSSPWLHPARSWAGAGLGVLLQVWPRCHAPSPLPATQPAVHGGHGRGGHGRGVVVWCGVAGWLARVCARGWVIGHVWKCVCVCVPASCVCGGSPAACGRQRAVGACVCHSGRPSTDCGPYGGAGRGLHRATGAHRLGARVCGYVGVWESACVRLCACMCGCVPASACVRMWM